MFPPCTRSLQLHMARERHPLTHHNLPQAAVDSQRTRAAERGARQSNRHQMARRGGGQGKSREHTAAGTGAVGLGGPRGERFSR